LLNYLMGVLLIAKKNAALPQCGFKGKTFTQKAGFRC